MAIFGFNHGIATHFPIFARQLAYALFVFHKKNGLRPPFDGMSVRTAVASAISFFIFDPGQINFKTGSTTRVAVHPDVSTALLHASVHRCKTKSCSFSLFLGCKEWLENVCLRFGVHTATLIGNREHHVLRGSQYTTRARVGSIQ